MNLLLCKNGGGQGLGAMGAQGEIMKNMPLFDKRVIGNDMARLQEKFPGVDKKRIFWKYARALLDSYNGASPGIRNDKSARGFFYILARKEVVADIEEEQRRVKTKGLPAPAMVAPLAKQETRFAAARAFFAKHFWFPKKYGEPALHDGAAKEMNNSALLHLKASPTASYASLCKRFRQSFHDIELMGCGSFTL